MEHPAGSPPKADRPFFFVGFLVLLALYLGLDVFYLHPDYCRTDEAWILDYLDRALDLGYPPMAWAQGSLLHALQWAACRLLDPSLGLLRSLNLAGLALECWLLYRLAHRWGGRPAAQAAVLFDLVAANTILRAHALTCWAWAPLWCLGTLSLALEGGVLAAALGGVLSALAWMDYEGWMAAFPALGCAVYWNLRHEPKRAKAFFGAQIVVTLVLIGLNRDVLRGWLAYRANLVSAPIHGYLLSRAYVNALAIVHGGPTLIPHLTVSEHPWLPPWGFALLVPGFWACRRRADLLLWCAVPMLLLAAPTQSPEPNRCIAAWPALALIAGLGWAWLTRVLDPPAPPSLLLVALACGGLFFESQAWGRHIEGFPKDYAASGLLRGFVAAEGPAMRGGQLAVLTRLDAFGNGGALRLLSRPCPEPSTATPQLAVLVPKDLIPDLGPDAEKSIWDLRSPGGDADLRFYWPKPDQRRRFLDLERRIKAWDGVWYMGAWSELRRLEAALNDPAPQDPLWRALLWRHWVELAYPQHGVTRAWAARLLAEPMRNTWALEDLGMRLYRSRRDPWLGWTLHRELYRRQPNHPRNAMEAALLALPEPPKDPQ